MTALRKTVARLFGKIAAEAAGAPPAAFTFAPTTPEEAAAVLDFSSGHGLTVLPWGGGTHQPADGLEPDVVLSTTRLKGIDWRPDDLTVVVGAGVAISALEDRLGERSQTAVLPEHPGAATVGGTVAAGASAWRRFRYGPTRDRVLEVVKNVSGYDIPRLFTGSMGSLGVITRVCLKLWPRSAATATVAVRDVARALAIAHRPLAILETPSGSRVYLGGTAAEVEAQAKELGGDPAPGLGWPVPPAGEVVLSLRVPPADTPAAVDRTGWADDFVAAHGVGEVVAAGSMGPDEAQDLRDWAESRGGSLVLLRGPDGFGLDPWGASAASATLQRRVKQAFDPLRVLVPGRLPGGV